LNRVFSEPGAVVGKFEVEIGEVLEFHGESALGAHAGCKVRLVRLRTSCPSARAVAE
jgi:hypothetical protein